MSLCISVIVYMCVCVFTCVFIYTQFYQILRASWDQTCSHFNSFTHCFSLSVISPPSVSYCGVTPTVCLAPSLLNMSLSKHYLYTAQTQYAKVIPVEHKTQGCEKMWPSEAERVGLSCIRLTHTWMLRYLLGGFMFPALPRAKGFP